MLVSKEYFHKHLIDPTGNLKKNTPNRVLGIPILDMDCVVYVAEGGIETHDSWTLSGSYALDDGKFYGLYTIKDFSNDSELPTKKQSFDRDVDRAIRSTFHYPNNVLKALFPEKWDLPHMSQTMEVLRAETGERMRCSFSHLTYDELNKLKDYYTAEEFERIRDKIVAQIKRDPMSYIYPTYEEPVVLRIEGDDDTSFTKLFPDTECCLKFLNEFSSRPPTNTDFYDKMVFSN